jgi:3D-(3,5/4)-trihydroxycyclohexane-1,2-dione acylhydrolase (decyclizing)
MEYGFSCMGYEVAAALGVAWAEPDREVYALVGDASYLMLHSELLTSLQEGTKITVVVFDNGGYGSINTLQRTHGSEGFGTELRRRNASGDLQGDQLAIDFAQMAQAMGAHGYTAHTAQELRRALVSARAESKSCVIDVKVKMGTGTTDSGVGWRVAVAQQSESEAVRSAADAVAKEFHTARY